MTEDIAFCMHAIFVCHDAKLDVVELEKTFQRTRLGEVLILRCDDFTLYTALLKLLQSFKQHNNTALRDEGHREQEFIAFFKFTNDRR